MRHLNVGGYYSPKVKFILGLFSMSFILFYFALIALLFLKVSMVFIGILFGLRILLLLVPTIISLKKLNNPWLGIGFPLLDVLYFIYYIVLGPISLFRSKEKW